MTQSINHQLDQQLLAFNQWKETLVQAMDDYQAWLSKHKLLTDEKQQRIQECRQTLATDRLTLAFVAEFSRGKTELINAIFFSDYGRRLLPSTAGRTTMCPTELFYDQDADSAYVRLLPVETRSRNTTLEQLKQDPHAWMTYPLDLSSAEQIATCLSEVVETRPAALKEAIDLGLYDPDQNPHQKDSPETVDIPKWRHAQISFPHPLLKQGLCILDTPGLNALGSEPELTLSMLPAAQAVLFVLAADTGVTRTDLEMWQNHIKGFERRRKQGLIVVLNKADTLWDELQSQTAIETAITEQCNETSQILGIDSRQIFPVSAQKGLLAKVKSDSDLLERSALGRLEAHLSQDILSDRREIIRDTISTEISQLLENTIGMVGSKQRGLGRQLTDLEALVGKSEHVITHMIEAAGSDHGAYLEDLQTFKENRTELLQQGERLLKILDLERIDYLIDDTRKRMDRNMTTLGLRGNMRRLFEAFRTDMQKLVKESDEVRKKARSIYRLFHTLHGFTVTQPKMFSVMRYRVDLETLMKEAEAFRKSLHTTISGKRYLIKQFFAALVVRARKILVSARREIESWLKMVLEPLAFQIRERRDQMESKLQDLQKISESRDTLQQRISDLKQQQAAVGREQSLLNDIYSRLHGSEAHSDTAEATPRHPLHHHPAGVQ